VLDGSGACGNEDIRQMWYKEKKWLAWNILICSLLAVGFAAVLMRTYYVNHSVFEYDMAEESSQYGLTLEVTKDWSEDAHGYTYGMQYDGAVYNYTESDLQNWKIVLELDDGCYVDSYWNGEVTFEGNELTLECMDYNKIVQAQDSQTFGFVLYGPTLDNVASGKVIFERYLRLKDLESFRILVVAVIILLTVDITIAVLDARNRRLKKRQQDFIDIINQSFLTFANMIDAKDPYTNGHSHRVAIYSYKIAEKMNLDTQTTWNLFYMALLHDIGKIGIPDAILKKNGKLTPQERKEIEKHVTMGGDILKDFNAIEGIEAGARYHHERYDGTGYAEGLKGKDIPLYARIIGVADAFDAMTSARCYRPKLPMETVVNELKNCAGTQFDPEIVPFMLELIEEGQAPVEVDADSLELTLKIKNT
jgi:5'-deoxynucleotidase YfbR-like HD superfamily hydrolase